MHNFCTLHIINENLEKFLIHRCNYILLSEVYCVWQVVKTATIILNNPVFRTKVVEEIKTHILYSITFSDILAVYEITWKNMVQPGRPQMTMAHAHYMLDT